jgi:quercetin dioxygenase-like cupin family protein
VRFVRRDDAPELDLSDHFSGHVTSHVLDGPAPDAPAVVVTTCGAGSVSAWHRHAGRQLLLILEGQAVVEADGDDACVVGPGTLAVLDPCERHRHGAAAGVPCTMLTLTWGATDWA